VIAIEADIQSRIEDAIARAQREPLPDPVRTYVGVFHEID